MTETAHRDRLLIPALAPFYAGIDPYLYPFMRCVVGVMLVPHSIEQIMRGVPVWAANWPAKLGFWPPTMWGWAAILIELIGGICIALGLFTRFFAAGAAIVLGVAAFGVHLQFGYFWTARGLEYPLMWGCMLLIIALRGGGEMSIDRKYLSREL